MHLPADWVIGVVLATLAAVVSNLGLNLQKKQHLENIESYGQIDARKKGYTKQRTWLLGMFLLGLGSILDFSALAFAAQSIVAPLGSLTLAANLVFAQWILGEAMHCIEIVATVLILGGCTMSVAFASHENKVYTMDSLYALFYEWRFILYGFVAMGIIISLWSAKSVFEKLEKHYLLHDRNPSDHYQRRVKMHRFIYPALSGVIGGQSVLFAKCLAEAVVSTISGKGVFVFYWQSYVCIFAMFTSVFFQVRWLNQGLQRFEALYCVPIFQTFWILTSITNGAILFAEYTEIFQRSYGLFFMLGVVVTVVGVILLSRRKGATIKHISAKMPLVEDMKEPLLSKPKPFFDFESLFDFEIPNPYPSDDQARRLTIGHSLLMGRTSIIVAERDEEEGNVVRRRRRMPLSARTMPPPRPVMEAGGQFGRQRSRSEDRVPNEGIGVNVSPLASISSPGRSPADWSPRLAARLGAALTEVIAQHPVAVISEVQLLKTPRVEDGGYLDSSSDATDTE